MSQFKAEVKELVIEPHPNADRLEIARVEGFTSIVPKGKFKSGDLAVYIPEAAIVPDTILKELGLEGKLAGKEHNRVKPMELRGVLSEGLLYRPAKWKKAWTAGTDLTEALGIAKWIPQIPLDLENSVEAAPGGIFGGYDIENLKAFPDVLQPDEQVAVSEKLHGTCVVAGIIDGVKFVTSKGLADKGLVLKDTGANPYWNVVHKYAILDHLEYIAKVLDETEIMMYGEGLGPQDLKYGFSNGDWGFRAFDIKSKGMGWWNWGIFHEICYDLGIPVVPILYGGPYDAELIQGLADGKTHLDAGHIREGVVIKPVIERRDDRIGRVILKLKGASYLLREQGTEYQ